MTIRLHRATCLISRATKTSVAIDTETMGLHPLRDRLCVVQLSNGDGSARCRADSVRAVNAPNLKKLLGDTRGHQDLPLRALRSRRAVPHPRRDAQPVYCTRSLAPDAHLHDRHGLKDLVREMLNVDLSKQQQSSDWGSEQLSEAQVAMRRPTCCTCISCATKLDAMLARAAAPTLPRRVSSFSRPGRRLDLLGWGEEDIFAHS